jgi:hypothetical protein
MFSVVLIYNSNNAHLICTEGGNTTVESADSAKKLAERYMAKNKNSYQNGYELYILDRTNGKLIASATVPTPALEWKEA